MHQLPNSIQQNGTKKEQRTKEQKNKRTKAHTLSPAAIFIFIFILACGDMLLPWLDAKLQHRIFSPLTRSLISLIHRSSIPSPQYDIDGRQNFKITEEWTSEAWSCKKPSIVTEDHLMRREDPTIFWFHPFIFWRPFALRRPLELLKNTALAKSMAQIGIETPLDYPHILSKPTINSESGETVPHLS
jgi:hypothetical protein